MNSCGIETGAVILAAGLSSRMGDFKPLLKIGNESLIGRVVRSMKSAGASPVVVVCGYRAAELREHLKDSAVLFAENPDYAGTQMMDSLLIGLDCLSGRCKRALITPADVPLVSIQTIKQLVEVKESFVRPVFDGQAGHPVVLGMELLPRLHSFSGQGGLRAAVESFAQITELLVQDMAVTLDADTPEEYERLKNYWRGLGAEE